MDLNPFTKRIAFLERQRELREGLSGKPFDDTQLKKLKALETLYQAACSGCLFGHGQVLWLKA